MVLHKSDINIKAFVESTCDIFYNTARSKNVTLKVRPYLIYPALQPPL